MKKNNIKYMSWYRLLVCLHITMHADAPVDLANSCMKQEHFEQAITHYKQALLEKPNDANLNFKCGLAHFKAGHIDTAITSFNTVLDLAKRPIPTVLYNIGYALKNAGRLDEAISYYDKVIKLDPNYEAAYLARGFALLNKGDFINGWQQHERYLKKAHKNGDKLRELIKNNNLNGKRIVLTYEGGLGDTIMFIRYVERLKKSGAYIICALQQTLTPLFADHPYIDEVQTLQQPLPYHDARATLMSLPAIYNDTEETLPNKTPYLYANEHLVNFWKEQLDHIPDLKVGLCWQVNVKNDVSRAPIARRGMPLKLWETLLKTPGIRAYNLQRFNGTEQITQLPHDCILHIHRELDAFNGPFMDTAALIKNLDLVISVDTAVAHLAGALGKPVLLLLPYAVDWRWIYGRKNSPWYPTMRIFKQPKPFDWNGVIRDVHTYLNTTYNLRIVS